jgi:hypothetical protein
VSHLVKRKSARGEGKENQMEGQTKERWQSLCEQASIEQDTQALMMLIDEINLLLEEKEKRLRQPSEAQSAA